jgi:hypothetical protein
MDESSDDGWIMATATATEEEERLHRVLLRWLGGGSLLLVLLQII